MRIATATAYNTMLSEMQNMDAQQSTLQTEESSGQSVTDPSDNPSAMNTAINLIAQQSQLTQYSNNATTALQQAQSSFSALSSLKSLTDQVSEIATEANNGTDSASQLTDYGTSVNQMIEEAVQLGNTQVDNNYIFSGTAVTTPPYSVTRDSAGDITGVTYAGNSNQAEIPLSSTSSIAPSTSGSTNQSIADLINQMISLRDALNTNNSSTIASSGQSIDSTEDTVIDAVAENGAIQNRIQTEQTQQTAMSTSLDTILTEKTSIDLPSTLVKLNAVQTAYQAVLESSAKIMSTNLLDYLATT